MSLYDDWIAAKRTAKTANSNVAWVGNPDRKLGDKLKAFERAKTAFDAANQKAVVAGKGPAWSQAGLAFIATLLPLRDAANGYRQQIEAQALSAPAKVALTGKLLMFMKAYTDQAARMEKLKKDLDFHMHQINL